MRDGQRCKCECECECGALTIMERELGDERAAVEVDEKAVERVGDVFSLIRRHRVAQVHDAVRRGRVGPPVVKANGKARV